MNLDPRADFDNPVHMDFEEPKDEKPKKPKKERKEKAPPQYATLPPAEVVTGTEVVGGVSARDRAAVNLRLAGASYAEVADTLDFRDASEARKAIERTLAKTHAPDDWESLRMIASARAEAQFKRSFAMAGADYLVLEDGTKVPNTEKLRWHQQASADLMNHAIITGAKAPTKVEITPDEEKLDALVSRLMLEMGHEDVLDAEVLELEQIPDEPKEEP